MNEERKYNLTLTESQANLIVRALDLFTRVGIGQFENVAEVYNHNFTLDAQTYDRIRAGLFIAKEGAGHPRNGSHGIHNKTVSNDFRVAHDLQQVVRHRIAWDRDPKGGIQVNFDEPRSISGLPLAQMTKVKS